MDVSQNEVIKRLEGLVAVMKDGGIDGFKKAFDEFCHWIGYKEWFYSNPSEPNDEDCRPDSFWVLKKEGVLEKLLEGAEFIPLLEYLKGKELELPEQKSTVVKAVELHLIDKILDAERIADEIYLTLRKETDRIAESKRIRDNAPLFVELATIYALKLQDFNKSEEMRKILEELLT